MADIVQTICWSILLLFLLPLNIICLLVLKHTRMNGVTKLFLISLTCADLNVAVLFVIPAIGTAIFDGNWPYSDAWCIIQAVTIQPNFSIVALSLFAVNLDRFIAISYPLRHSQIVTFKRALIVSIFIWSSVLPVGLVTGYIYDWKAKYSPLRQSCSFEDNFWYLLVIQDIMLLLTVVMYARIICIIRNHHQNSANLGVVSDRNTKNRKSATTMFLLSFATLTCIAPLEAALVLQTLFKVDIPIAVAVVCNLCFSSSGIWDCVLYYMRNKTIRKAAVDYFSSFKSSMSYRSSPSY